MSGNGIIWAICNSALCSRQITMPAPHHSVFLPFLSPNQQHQSTEGIFSNKIYGSNFIKQLSETVTVWNHQNADCSWKNKFIMLFSIIFGTLSFPSYYLSSFPKVAKWHFRFFLLWFQTNGSCWNGYHPTLSSLDVSICWLNWFFENQFLWIYPIISWISTE